MNDILARLQPIFRDVFDQKDLVVTRESNAASVSGWDSLTHVSLVVALEQEFKVKFGLGELQELENVGGIVDLIGRKVG
jgi:acyl carrier protein